HEFSGLRTLSGFVDCYKVAGVAKVAVCAVKYSAPPSRRSALRPSSNCGTAFHVVLRPVVVSKYDPLTDWNVGHQCFCKSPRPGSPHMPRQAMASLASLVG